MNWNSSTDTGWFVNLAEDGSAVTIFDPSGSVYGALFPTHTDEGDQTPGRRKRDSSRAARDRQALTFRKGHPATLRLSGGMTGTVTDQQPKAMRRKNKRCEVVISDRTYVFAHSSSRRATALRDGSALAHMARGRWSNRSTVTRKTVSVTDALDECVLTLFQKVVTPGRTGAFDQVISDLSSI